MRAWIGGLAVATFAVALAFAAGCRREGPPRPSEALPSQVLASAQTTAPRRPPEVHDNLAARVTTVLAVTFSVPKEQAVGVPKLRPGQRVPAWATVFTWKGEELDIAVTPQDGTIRIGPKPWVQPARVEALPETQQAGLAAAQADARRMLDKLFTGQERRRLQPTAATVTDAGFYRVVWRGELSPGVTTGDTATFVFAPQGRLSSYAERRAPRRVQLAEVRVSLDDARNVAMRVMARRMSRGTTWGPTDTTLVLSSPRLPDQGPVWEVGVRASVEAGPETVGEEPGSERVGWTETMVIDAVTGEAFPSSGPPLP